MSELDDALTAYGAVELPGDRDEPGQRVVSDPAGWGWAPMTCNYVVAMMDAWGTDEPAARHPWLMAQATRIAVAHRNGCFDEAGYHGAVGVLASRFRDLIARGTAATGARREAPGEIADALAWGRGLAGSMTENQVAAELGRHRHEQLDTLTFDRSSMPDFPLVNASQEGATEDATGELFAKEVEWAAHKLRVQAAARELIAAEQAAALDVPPFDAGTLGEILQRPAEPPYRAEGLIPNEASALIVAMRKTGKTTLNLNLARSLILGEEFLGRFPVRPISGNVGLLNYEVSSAQIARWADEVGIPYERLCIVNLRGRRNPLGNDDDKERLAAWLRDHDCESLIVDPFGRAYTGVSQNDPGEVGAWLANLDRWARGEVGALDLVLSVHAGWEGERSRGSSALEDWGDTIITMTRRKAGESGDDGEGDDGHRYLRAEGRDVDVDEDQLEYNPLNRLLTLTGYGSRRKAGGSRRVDLLLPVVVGYIEEHPTCGQNEIERGLKGVAGYHIPSVREAVNLAVERGLITRTKVGQRFSHMAAAPLSLASNIPTASNRVQTASMDAAATASTASIKDAGRAVAGPQEILTQFPRTRTQSCDDPTHSPRFKSGRWICPDCDAREGVGAS